MRQFAYSSVSANTKSSKSISIAIIVNLTRKKLPMNDFESMWKDLGAPAPSEVENNEETPEYQIRDGIAKYKILTDLLSKYYHAKHGEPMPEGFDPNNVHNDISFRLS